MSPMHKPPHLKDAVPVAGLSKASQARQHDQQITDGLQAIYGTDHSDLHQVERDDSGLTRVLTRIVLALALLASLAFGGFFVYTSLFAPQSAREMLVMTIESPPVAKSGELVQIVVKYVNPSRTPLASLEVDVNLPTSFVPTLFEPAPTNTDELIWNLGSLGAHSDGQLVLEGVWLSSVPATTNFQAIAAYKPGNFNSTFSHVATTAVATLGSVLTLDVQGEEQAASGQTITYTARVQNTGLQALAGAQLALRLPAGFILASSTPALEPGTEPVWELGLLAPGAIADVVWAGAFSADVNGVLEFVAVVSLAQAEQQLSQVETQRFTQVAGSDLRATIVVNGNTDQATTEPGGILRVSVRLENAGDQVIDNAAYLLDFKPDSGVPLVWNSAALAGGRLTSAGIVFEAATVGTLKPGDRKTFNLSFPVKTTLGPSDVDTWSATVFVSVGNTSVQTLPFPIALKASANLSASARFYSDTGASLGSGPLPPTVGEATTYRVFWQLDEAVHELEEIVVTATLAPGVTWVDRSLLSSGNLQFDPVTQILRWEMADLPANQAATAEFTVQLVPDENDIGTFVDLLSGSIVSATDADTRALVTAEAGVLTTEIPEDIFATGQGVVVD